MSFDYNILSLAIFIYYFILDGLNLTYCPLVVRHISLVVSFRSDIFRFEHMDQLIMKIKDQTDGT